MYMSENRLVVIFETTVQFLLSFSFACVGAAMANETWKFVQQAKSKQAMKQVHEREGCAAAERREGRDAVNRELNVRVG